MKDYYYILGITETASPEEIKKAYKKLATKFHPDKNNGDEFFANRFKEILEAYEILSDSLERANYDREKSASKEEFSEVKLTPEIEYFRANKVTIEFDEEITFYWKTINADRVILQPYGIVGANGKKTLKIKDLKLRLEFKLIAENTNIGKQINSILIITNKTHIDLNKINTGHSGNPIPPTQTANNKRRSYNGTFILVLIILIFILFKHFSDENAKTNLSNNNIASQIQNKKVEIAENPKSVQVEYENPIFEDIDGNYYNTITIGSQKWMSENLKTTRLNDGIPIPLIRDDNSWSVLTTPGFCWSYNSSGTLGILYNWYTVSTRKLCPIGWHVPSIEEWTSLATFLGGKQVAGSKLKEAGTSHWISLNSGTTNETGFTALPYGCHYVGESVNYSGYSAYWWSSTETSPITAWNCSVTFGDGFLYSNQNSKGNGLSIRCIKD